MANNENEIINIVIPFRKVWMANETGGKSGKLGLRVGDCIAELKEDDKAIGSVAGLLGGGLELQINGDQDTHIIARAADIWNAYCEAVNKPDLKYIKD